MISQSGLIKIPKELLEGVIHQARVIFLSSAYSITRLDASVTKYHNLILNMCQHYNITPIEKHLLKGEFIVRYNDDDLPPDYFKYCQHGTKSIAVKIDWTSTQYYGYYTESDNTLGICPVKIYSILHDPHFDEHALFAAFEHINGTIKHELTHMVQRIYLHSSNYTMLPDYAKYGSDYYNSMTEFHPTLKSDLSSFASLAYKLDPKFYNNAIRYWVGYDISNANLDGIVPSTFFGFLRRKNEPMYIKAVKLFASKAKDAIRDYIQEHSVVTNLQAKRLDCVFCNLRLNDFANFAKIINTFVAFPDTRLHDYGAIKEYLDLIDARFKQRGTNLLFVPCGDKAIDYIVRRKKSFVVDTIFSNSEIVGDGMLFEFGDVPVILNISTITHDPDYCNVCDQYDIVHLEGDFVIADGSNFKFDASNLKGVYKNGILQS